MQRERWLKVKELRDQAESMSMDERRSWLEDACGEDTSLFRETMSLLEEDEGLTSHVGAIGSVEPEGEMTGVQLGSWRMIREIGRGGMGAIWLAERADSEFSMPAAIKFIKAVGTENKLVSRFKRERQFLADLRHPNIAILLDGGSTSEGLPYLVMEYVDGWTIDTWCDVNSPTTKELINLFRQICLAVSYTHRKGVLHRDIKPTNIMITGEGVPKLMDFGIAGWIDETNDDDMTIFGCYPITPEYASPERLKGDRPMPSCDIYALGLVLFRLLSGRRPRSIEGNYADHLREQIEHGDRNGKFMAKAADLIEVLTLQDIAHRLATMEELLERCDDILYGDSGFSNVASSLDLAPSYDAMLWYHQSNRQVAEMLARRLEDEVGLHIWLDQWHLVPGAEVPSTLAATLDLCGALVVLLAPESYGPWMDQAQRMALSAKLAGSEQRIVPILLPGAARPEKESTLPAFLRRRAWAEMTDLESYHELETIALAVRGVPPGRPDDDTHTKGACPFRGLEAFREDDRHFFFGREAITQRLVNHMMQRRFLAVLGASGSGKSSVVQAGLIPKLRESGYAPTLFTPSQAPLEELAYAIAAHLALYDIDLAHEDIKDQLYQHDHALHDMATMLQLAGGPHKICLVIDQFEEVFTLARDKYRTSQFLANLLHAVEQPDPVVSVVLTMRSDFLDKTGDYLDLDDYITENMIHIKSMNREELSRAVTEPARLAGLSFEGGLVEKILDDVYGGAGELPLLEHALLELYHRRRGKLMTATAYAEIGGIEGALARRAENVYQETEQAGRDMTRRMFTLCLVQPGEGGEDTRRRATQEELLTVAGKVEAARTILQRWVSARLLTISRDEGRTVDMVDVAHEALIRRWQRIGTWMDENRDTARLLDRLRRSTHAWEESGRNADHLLRGAPLLQAVELINQKEINLTTEELDFIHAAEVHQEQLAQKDLETARSLLWRSRLIAALILLGLMAASVLAWQLRQERDLAEQQAQELGEVSTTVAAMFFSSEADRATGREVTIDEMIDNFVNSRKTGESSPALAVRLQETFGLIYQFRGRYSEAIRVLKEGLVLAQSKFGDDSIYTAVIKERLGEALMANGQLEQAELYLSHALTTMRTHWPDRENEIATVLKQMGTMRYKQKNFDEAEHYFLKSLAIRRKLHGRSHLSIAEIEKGLGNTYRKKGDWDKAETHFNQAIDMFRELKGDQHRDMALTLNDMAGFLKERGNMDEAAAYYANAMTIYHKILGKNHPTIATITNNLASLHVSQGKYYEAEPLYRNALHMRHELLTPMHPRLGDSIYTLGFVMQKIKEFDNAAYLYQMELDFRRSIHGDKHPSLAYCYEALADIKLAMNQYAEAEQHAVKADVLWEELSGNDHENRLKGLMLAAEAISRQGRASEAARYVKEARRIAATNKRVPDWYQFAFNSVEGLTAVQLGKRGQVFDHMTSAWNELVCLEKRQQAEAARRRLILALELANREDRARFWRENMRE